MLCVVLYCRRAAERKLTTGVHKCIYRIVRMSRREETCSTEVEREYAVPWMRYERDRLHVLYRKYIRRMITSGRGIIPSYGIASASHVCVLYREIARYRFYIETI